LRLSKERQQELVEWQNPLASFPNPHTTPVMPTAIRRKSVRLRKAPRKTVPAHRAKVPAFILSEAEIARINGAQESLVALP
jgi:hypothetical protein